MVYVSAYFGFNVDAINIEALNWRENLIVTEQMAEQAGLVSCLAVSLKCFGEALLPVLLILI